MKTSVILGFCCYMLSGSVVNSQNLVTPEMEKMICTETVLCENAKYIWAESNLGLLRINKKNFKAWRITGNADMPCEDITCMLCLPDGTTYIGTKYGILFWDNYAFLSITTENSWLPENHIVKMTPYRGGILITTKNGSEVECYGTTVKKLKHTSVTETREVFAQLCSACPEWMQYVSSSDDYIR